MDANFFIAFLLGGLSTCSAMGGYAVLRFREYEEEIRKLKEEAEEEWIHRDRMQTWIREE